MADGNDLDAIEKAVQAAKDAVCRPSLIKISTHIAYGSPSKQDSPDAHGSPLGEEEIKVVKKFYGLPEDKDFYVPDQVLANTRKALVYGEQYEKIWQEEFTRNNFV